MEYPKRKDDDLNRDQTSTGFVDPLVTEKVMDLTQESIRINKFSFKPLTVGQRRTVAQRLDELDVDPIAVLAALAMGLDPRTGEPLVAVKPMKVKQMVAKTKEGEPIMQEIIINHEYPGATPETMAFCAKELAGFVYPKLKQVEHKNDLDDKKTFTVVWAGDQPKWAQPRQVTQIQITSSSSEPQTIEGNSDAKTTL